MPSSGSDEPSDARACTTVTLDAVDAVIDGDHVSSEPLGRRTFIVTATTAVPATGVVPMTIETDLLGPRSPAYSATSDSRQAGGADGEEGGSATRTSGRWDLCAAERA